MHKTWAVVMTGTLAVVVLLAQAGATFADDGTEGEPSADGIVVKDPAAEESLPTVEQLLKRIKVLESRLSEQEGQPEAPPASAPKEEPSWTDVVEVGGDLRYRHEWLDWDSNKHDRHRHRIRARLQVGVKLLEEVDLGFEMSTGHTVDANGEGEGDPASNNQTLTDAWSLKSFWISQAYFDYHPEAVEGLHVLVGKAKRPFITPVSCELVWDSDVNPEGLVAKYKHAHDSLEVFLQLYWFWVVERSAAGDTGLFGVQAAGKYALTLFEDKAHVMAGVSYYNYGNAEDQALFVESDSFGNTTNPAGNFAEDFDLFEFFAEFACRIREIPVAVFVDYVTNTAADDEDAGWAFGFKVNKAKKPGSWEGRYQYKKVEADAVFGTFADSDFGGGQTDSKGHEINVAYQVDDNWQVGVTYFNNDINFMSGRTDDEFQRAQIDFLFNF